MKRALLLATMFACSPTIGGDDDSGGPSIVAADVDDTVVDSDLTPVVDAAAQPHLEAFFAVPLQDGTGDATLENKIIELIDGTPKGARIRMSMYQWSRTNVATHIVAAHTRGVDVRIVLDKEQNEAKAVARLVPTTDGDDADLDQAGVDDDGASDDIDAAADPDTDPGELVAAKRSLMNPAVTILQEGLPSGAITFCTRGDGSCQGTHIDHNKIYMFSTTGGAHDVVVQSSANLTTHHLHNNLVISRNDAELYTAYVHYFSALQKKKLDLNYYRSEDGDHTIGYFFPRGAGDGDTIVNILNKVTCTSSSEHVRVAMAFFTQDRHGIADRLVALSKAGCDVRVNMRHAGQDVSASIINTLKKGGVDVKLYPDDHGTNIHSKYLLVDAGYENAAGDHPRRKLVWTGSHNYTGGALHTNDEALLRVDNATVFGQFMTNWNTMRMQM